MGLISCPAAGCVLLLLSPLHGRLSDGMMQASGFSHPVRVMIAGKRFFVPCAYLVVHFWVRYEQLRLCMRRPGRCIAREDTGCPRGSSGGHSCLGFEPFSTKTHRRSVIPFEVVREKK